MPIYEYRCENCNESFSVKISMAEHDTGNIACPSCQQSRLVPHYSSFFREDQQEELRNREVEP